MLPTSISLASNLNPASPGTPLTFSGTVAPSTAHGTVGLYDNATGSAVELGRVFIGLRGSWTYTLNPYGGHGLVVGYHPLTAVYLGNATYQGSTSPAYTEYIRGAHW